MGTSKTPRPKKERFLQAVALTGNMTQAAKLAGCSRHTHRDWMKDDPEYPERFKEAMEEAADLLEHEARRRGVDGMRRLKFQGGAVLLDPETKKPYVEYEYSDTLLIFLLKGARPEKYRERYEAKVDFPKPETERNEYFTRRMAQLDRLLRPVTESGGNGRPRSGDGLGGNGQEGQDESA